MVPVVFMVRQGAKDSLYRFFALWLWPHRFFSHSRSTTKKTKSNMLNMTIIFLFRILSFSLSTPTPALTCNYVHNFSSLLIPRSCMQPMPARPWPISSHPILVDSILLFSLQAMFSLRLPGERRKCKERKASHNRIVISGVLGKQGTWSEKKKNRKNLSK